MGEERYPSVVPFLPPLTDATIREYFRFYIASVGTLVLFGGLLAPMLEVRLGLGGASSPVCRPACIVCRLAGMADEPHGCAVVARGPGQRSLHCICAWFTSHS